MPIGEFPILEVVVRQLARHGFDHITLAVNHQAEIIRAFFGDGAKWGVTIDYSLEDAPLGTMGPLRLIPDLPEHFLVMNGDLLTDIDFSRFHDEHVAAQELFTVSSYRREQRIDYGTLEADSEGRLQRFAEKPVVPYEVSMGIYMVSRRAIEHVPVGEPYGFDQLMLALLGAQQTVRVRSFGGYWLDIGRPDDYAQAIEEFDHMRHRFLDD